MVDAARLLQEGEEEETKAARLKYEQETRLRIEVEAVLHKDEERLRIEAETAESARLQKQGEERL